MGRVLGPLLSLKLTIAKYLNGLFKTDKTLGSAVFGNDITLAYFHTSGYCDVIQIKLNI